MEPTNYSPIPTGIEYLNQIAPPPPPPRSNRAKVIAGIIGLAGLLIVSIILISASQAGDKGPTPLKLAARLQMMKSVTDSVEKKLRTSEMQDLNSSLKSILLTANQEIATPLLAYEVDANKQSKEIAALDPSDELIAKLNDASLNTQLDDTYAREMYFLIEDTIIMMDQLYKQVKVDSMLEYIEDIYENLNNIKKRFESLTAVSSPTPTIPIEEE